MSEVIAKRMALTFEVYQDKKKQWRWRLRAGNRRIIADSAESYSRKYDVLRSIELVRLAGSVSEVVLSVRGTRALTL